jgi:predicted transcriptional regulator
MKTSVELDDELVAELERTVSLVREKPATILRLAIRAGLPIVAGRHQAARPDGYFAEAYEQYPTERQELEAAFAKTKFRPER